MLEPAAQPSRLKAAEKLVEEVLAVLKRERLRGMDHAVQVRVHELLLPL